MEGLVEVVRPGARGFSWKGGALGYFILKMYIVLTIRNMHILVDADKSKKLH
jgi:hypothetical protein